MDTAMGSEQALAAEKRRVWIPTELPAKCSREVFKKTRSSVKNCKEQIENKAATLRSHCVASYYGHGVNARAIPNP